MRRINRLTFRVFGALALLLSFSAALQAQTVTLAWNPNTESDLSGYVVYYGTASGIYTNSIPVGNVTTYPVTGLVIGQPYYFAVKAINTSGIESVNFSNEVSSASPASGQLTTPSPGSTLTGSTVTFQWSAGINVPSYQLSVGTTPGDGNLFDQVVGGSLSATVSGLPTNGSPVYVRLWSLVGSVWFFRDYTYTASTVALPALTIGNTSVTEGNSGTTTATFTVTLSPTSTQTVTVAYGTSAGSATAGSDYVTKTGTLTFAPGTSTQSITVTVNGDTTVEPNETFTVNLSSPTNATISGGQGTGTIVNDDAALPSLGINNVSVTEGNTGTTTATFTVTLTPVSTQIVTVAFATGGGTATAGSDYVARNGTLTFAAGVATQSIAVTVNGDTTFEPNETFNVNLSSPANAVIGNAQGVATIVNDDAAPPPTATVSATTVYPGDMLTVTVANGPGNVLDWVALTDASAPDSTYLAWKYLNDTTSAPATGMTGGTLHFAAPSTLGTYNLRFFTGTTKLATTATVTVQALPSLSINNASVMEGNSGTATATFTATLTPVSTQTVTVAYGTAAGTATAPSDFVMKTGTLTFPPGTSTQSITVTVNGDTSVEPNETFMVNLSSPINATVSNPQGVGTIMNDDAAPPVLAVNNVSVTEGNSGTKTATFTVTLMPTSTQTVTVAYHTSAGSATAPSDFLANSGTLTFAAGVSTQSIAVTVNGDTTVEPDETFFVNLSAPANATISDAQGVGTILNDDAAAGPTATVSATAVNPGAPIAVTIANGPGNPGDWVALAPSSAPDSTYIVWKYLNDSTMAPPTGMTGGTLNFAAPATPGTYNFRLFAGSTRLATSAIVTVQTQPTLTINNVSVAEGNSGTTTATFTVTLTPTSGQTVTVAYATANGTATAGSDYVAKSGTLTFAPGIATQTIAVVVNGDTTPESDETFVINLSGPTNAVLGDTQGTGTIGNDDAAPAPVVSVSSTTVNPGGLVTVTVANGPANVSDWVSLSSTSATDSSYLQWKYLSDTSAPPPTGLSVATLHFGMPTTPGTYNFRFFTGATKLATSAAVTVQAPPPPTMTVSATTVNPGSPISVTVANGPASLSDWVAFAPASAPDSTYLAWKYLNDTTSPPATGLSGATLNFVAPTAPGTYNFRFFSGTARLATSATVTVQSSPTLTIGNVSVIEGNSGTTTATFTVMLTPASGQTVTVAYATANGTATAGSDYVAKSGTLTFAPGSATQTIAVVVNGETTPEADETFVVNLSSPTNAILGNTQGVGTIRNDDAVPGPTVTVSAATVDPGDVITITVASGPGNPGDWVAMAAANAPDATYLGWKYLNDSTMTPPTGLTGGTLHFMAPSTPGTYNFRFFSGTTKLATSATVTVTGPVGPSLTVSATTVQPGGVIDVIVANGPGNALDWVALSSTAAPDSVYLAWVYLNGSTIPPGGGITSATLRFFAPTTPGTYNFRFFANYGFTKIATSGTFTVQ